MSLQQTVSIRLCATSLRGESKKALPEIENRINKERKMRFNNTVALLALPMVACHCASPNRETGCLKVQFQATMSPPPRPLLSGCGQQVSVGYLRL
jgi:hypothetical protein